MTVPLTGGRTFSLVPGAAPTPITQYAPGGDEALLIINLDVSAGRLYVGGDSSVSPTNGVPVDPGTAIPWSEAGQVWAVADPAATANLTVVVTAAISQWTPSPAAIAAEVAAELLATGVPNVLTLAMITNNQNINNGSSAQWDVSGYGSINVRISSQTGGVVTANQYFKDNANSLHIISADALPVITGGGPIEIAVIGNTFEIVNNSGALIGVTIVGSNRQTPRRTDARNQYETGDAWSQGSQALTAGTVYPLNQVGALSGSRLAGLVVATFFVPGTTVKGNFRMNTQARNITLATTAEMTTAPDSNQYVVKQIAVPASGDYNLEFKCTTAGTTSLFVDLIPA